MVGQGKKKKNSKASKTPASSFWEYIFFAKNKRRKEKHK